MKKFILSFIACLAFAQSMYGACSPLCNSEREYGAILEAISIQFPDVIPTSESIVDIRRKTKEVEVLGIVKYLIVTRIPSDTPAIELSCHHSSGKSHKPHQKCHTYLATLLISPNTGVGPVMVTVENIEQISGHKCPD